MRLVWSRRFCQVIAVAITLAMVLEFPAAAVAQLQESLLTQPIGAAPSTATSDTSGVASSQTRELVEKRTATSKEFLEPNGRHRVEVYLEPVNYEDASGAWQPIDEKLLVSKRAGFALENKTNAFATYLGAGESQGQVKIEDGFLGLLFSPLGTQSQVDSSATAPTVLGGTATYADLFPGTGVRYSVLPGEVKEELVLASAQAPTTFAFRVQTQGLTPQANSDGSITFADETGTARFQIPRPWALDSGPEKPARVDLVQTLRAKGSDYVLEVKLDPSFLSDPGRVFPVIVDPTVIVQPANADAFVSSSYPSTDYWSSTFLLVGNDLTYGTTKSLLKFSLPTLSGCPQIQEAHLSLYKDYPGSETGTNTIEAYRIGMDWTANPPTYNSPANLNLALTPDSATSADGPGGWYDFDITASVNLWYAGLATNYGTLLRSTGGVAGSARRFFSSEYATATFRPKLTFTYLFGDPRHTVYDLGEFAGHAAQAVLDKSRLEVETTDLAIASFGPPASLARHYSSSLTTAGTFAPGWLFSFEQKLVFPGGSKTDYVDAAGETHTFCDTGTAWLPPNGLVATLTHPGSNWTLALKDRIVLTFDSTGKLLSESDRTGNTVSYTWGTSGSGLPVLTITAANGQQIQVTLNGSGKVTSASYTTNNGTRQVIYATAYPWQVTYFPSGALQHTVTYNYTSNRLSGIKAAGFSATAGDVTEGFIYSGAILTEVRFPDKDSVVSLVNGSNADARATFSYTAGQATVTRWGCVRTASAPTGATGTAVTQVFTWNPAGTMASRNNPKASGTDETWLYAYSSGTNLLLSETSPLSKLRQWTYDARGNVLTEQDELNHQATYTYPTIDTDPNRDLPLTKTDPLGSTTTFTYDASGNQTEQAQVLNTNVTDNLARTTWAYADVTVGSTTYHGALTQERRLVTGATWATTDYNTDVYYPNGEPKKIVSRGVALYDPAVTPTSAPTSPIDLTVTRTYDAFGNLLTKTDTSGEVTQTNIHDLAGRVLLQTGPSFTATVGGSAQSTQTVNHHVYDAWGHETTSYRTSTADSAQQRDDYTVHVYDACGRVATETFSLWSGGQLLTQRVVTDRYDGLGRKIMTADSTVSGQPALTAYDAAGNVVEDWQAGVSSYVDDKATRHLLADNTSAYDAANHLLQTTNPGETASSTSTYTDDGNVLRGTAADGTWTDYQYDAAGHVTATTRSDGGTTSSTYDLGSRLVSITDENNATTTLAHDCLGRQVGASAGGAPTSTTSLNALGWELMRVDADGITHTQVYDQAGNVTQETTAGRTTISTYDGAGNLLEQADPDDRRVDLTYDYFGLASRELQSVPGSPTRVTVKDTTTSYDSLGRTVDSTDNLTQVTHHFAYPLNTPGTATETLTVGTLGTDAAQTAITAGANGQETGRSTTIASSPQLPTVVRTIVSRDSGQRVTAATLDASAGVVAQSNSSYDAAGRLQRQWGTSGGGSGYTSTAQSTDAYTYDPTSGRKSADNLQFASVGTAGVLTGSYTYTADGRLRTATVLGVAETDTFAPSGNLTSFVKGGVTTTLTYDSANRLQTATAGGVTTYYSWDVTNGWRTSQGPTADENDLNRIRFTYTGTGRLASYSNPGTATTATYSYDGVDQRKQSVVTVGRQTTTTGFTYEGLKLLRLTATQSGGTDPTSWQITYLYDENDRPYAGVYRSPASSTTATVFGILTTDRGDVVGLLDAAGSPFAAYRYDAWGNPQGTGNVTTGMWSQSTTLVDSALATRIAGRQPLRYGGYHYDSQSGLYYLSAREYDPLARQFTSKDSAKADGEGSAYQYCAGNPISRVDLSGAYFRKINPDTGEFKFRKTEAGHSNWCWVAAGQAIAWTLGRTDVSQTKFCSLGHNGDTSDRAGFPWDVTRALNGLGLHATWNPVVLRPSIWDLAYRMTRKQPVDIFMSALDGNYNVQLSGGHVLVLWAVDPENGLVKLWDPNYYDPRTWSWTYQGMYNKIKSLHWVWTAYAYATR